MENTTTVNLCWVFRFYNSIVAEIINQQIIVGFVWMFSNVVVSALNT